MPEVLVPTRDDQIQFDRAQIVIDTILGELTKQRIGAH